MTTGTKVTTKVATTKPPTINLPITSLAEWKRAVFVVLAQDGKRESRISSWSFPKAPEGFSAFLAVPPRGTQSHTLKLLAPKLGGSLVFLGARGAIAAPAPIGGKFLGPVSPMVTFEDVKRTAKYYILAGDLPGISLTDWAIWLGSNHTDVIIMPKAGTTVDALSKLAEKMGGGHVDPLVTPKGGGRKRPAVVVGVAWTPLCRNGDFSRWLPSHCSSGSRSSPSCSGRPSPVADDRGAVPRFLAPGPG